MLVGTGQEHDVVALHPLEAGQRVTGHGGVAVADVQLVAGVINGGGDVKCLVLAHRVAHPFLQREKIGGRGTEKSPRPDRQECLTRTGAVLPWYHLASPCPCGQRPLRRGRADASHPAKRGNGRTRRRLRDSICPFARAAQGPSSAVCACPVPPVGLSARRRPKRTLPIAACLLMPLYNTQKAPLCQLYTG